jgi:hypothetical protein
MVNNRQTAWSTIVKTWSTIVKTHGQQSSTHMVNNRQHIWSNIVTTHGHTSSNNMVKHRQQTWSNIVKQHGHTSSKHMVEHHQRTCNRLRLSRTATRIRVCMLVCVCAYMYIGVFMCWLLQVSVMSDHIILDLHRYPPHMFHKFMQHYIRIHVEITDMHQHDMLPHIGIVDGSCAVHL